MFDSRGAIRGKGGLVVQEYKRTCNACGKVWHSLASREAELINRRVANAAQVAAGCCSPAVGSQGMATATLIDNEMERLKTCPECGSSSHGLEIVDYDGAEAVDDDDDEDTSAPSSR